MVLVYALKNISLFYYFSATVFDNNWTREDHILVGLILRTNILTVKTNEFRRDIRVILINFRIKRILHVGLLM